MEYSQIRYRWNNPKERAGWFSIITFWYTLGLFKTGLARELQEPDVYKIPEKFNSATVGSKLEKEWKFLCKTHKTPSLYKALAKAYWKKYLLWSLLQLIMKTIAVLGIIYCTKHIVKYFTVSKSSHAGDLITVVVAIMVFIKLFNAFYVNNLRLAIIELAMEIRTALCSLIFRKCLRLKLTAFAEFNIGKIITLISKDVYNIEQAVIFSIDMFVGLCHLIAATVLVYKFVGAVALTGIGFIVLIIVLETFIGKLIAIMRLKTAKETDSRIKITNEMLSSIKMIKMCSWSSLFLDKISSKRKDEIAKLKVVYYLKVLIATCAGMATKIGFYIAAFIYTGAETFFQAQLIYSIKAAFQQLTVLVLSIPFGIIYIAEMSASVERITKLLLAEEIQPKTNCKATQRSEINIKLTDVTVSIKDKTILKRVNLELRRGLTVVIGTVGNGKSSLLKTIIEEYPITSGKVLVTGDISYASEEPWMFPGTIKQNVVFGETYDVTRYTKVMELCALTYDLKYMAKGDKTVIGDRGLNLSRGQQSRINLARAIYKDSDIYLLDDCLASLDNTVQEHIFSSCIRNFLKDKLVVMITNNPKVIQQADNVLLVENGIVTSVLDASEASKNIAEFMENLNEEARTTVDQSEDIITSDEVVGDEEQEKLISKPQSKVYEETKKSGKVVWEVYRRYLKYAGVRVVVCVGVLFIITQGCLSAMDGLVSKWVNTEETLIKYKLNNTVNSTEYSKAEQEKNRLFNIYSIVLVTALFLTAIRAFLHFISCARICNRIHVTMISSVVNATMEFFDTHFIGNILNRFSKDIGTVDEKIPTLAYEVTRASCMIVASAAMIIAKGKLFIIPIVVFFALVFLFRIFYLSTSRSLKRLECTTRSPVVGHANASLEGLITIRAFGKQNVIMTEFDHHQDLYTSAFYMTQMAARAFGFLVDLCCAFFVAVILTMSFFISGMMAGDIGLIIVQTIVVTDFIEKLVQDSAELENQMTSVERVLEYADVKKENQTGLDVENWPEQGAIEFKAVSLTYKKTNETVLKDITFKVLPSEKIGIIGRTGAGKSSLISVLCRLYEYDGDVLIDDILTKTVPVDYLRSKIAIIPQNPLFFTGTIRKNLDPFDFHTDQELWSALDTLGIKSLINDLSDTVSDSGSTFSSGQKQLLCLTRAILQKNKIIVLDEATGNMDVETDKQIQAIIQEKFAFCTVLTIAHRLTSVMSSDKIMIVDQGKIIEFDNPNTLLSDNRSKFYQLLLQAELLSRT